MIRYFQLSLLVCFYFAIVVHPQCTNGQVPINVTDSSPSTLTVCADFQQQILDCTDIRYSGTLTAGQNISGFSLDCNDCSGITGSNIFIIDIINGPQACGHINQQVLNCEVYVRINALQITCSQCKGNLIYVQTSTGHMCAQVQVPNCQLYQDSGSNSGSLDIIQCASCWSGFEQISSLTIDYYSGIYGVGCVVTGSADSCDGMALTEKGQYICNSCVGGKTLTMKQDGNMTCVDNTVRSTYEVPGCLKYSGDVFTSNGAQCAECDPAGSYPYYVQRVNISGTIVPYCLTNSLYQVGCNTYNFFLSTQIYCSTDCKTGFSPIIVRNSSNSYYQCSKLQPIPYCIDYYGTGGLGDSRLYYYCDTCSTGYTVPYCTDGSNGCTAGEISVTIRITDPSSDFSACFASTTAPLVSWCTLYQGTSIPQITKCIQCRSGYVLANNTNLEQFCVQEIPFCQIYDAEDWRICTRCANNTPFDSEQARCLVANDLIQNCEDIKYENNNAICVKCRYGFDTDFNKRRCVPSVEFCQLYDINKLCTQCIPNYDLINQVCIPLPQNCQKVLPSGQCQTCSTGYILDKTVCVSTCTEGQYLNQQGNCKEGNVPNCAQYERNGTCKQCKQGTQFTRDFSQCNQIQQPLTCPPDTTSIRYHIIRGVCVSVDANCLQNLDNGYCFVCSTGFFASGGRCFPYI